ncbi:F-box/kelch-repeat protein At1g30090 [Ananas comosus]|uniref:F-box/kelch-repeat protein n=1 Tax=Ananas comosus TaxID=4615 RepID=A0A199V8D0_ANACO|nr:F-box/kelch-repeat protein At1g30090 [Ananas comosus]OAY73268.1 F-box/kelch-repeat protein [Ananas comosus]
MRRVRVSSHQSPVLKLGDSQMKLTPKFRFATATPSYPSSASSSYEPDSSLDLTPLIPGLPDDVALNCLLRLPVDTHKACRLVCRRWHRLLANKERFFAQRKALGFRDPWLFTLAFHRCTGKIQWQVLDLIHFSWHTIPAMPCRERACPRGFGCIAVPPDGTLLVCGGLVSDMDCPLHLVLKYEIYKNRWTVMSRMLAARSFFARGVIDGRVYVAGGYSTDQFELDSAEVLDPVKGNWQPIANMGTIMASSDSAVLNGRLYVTEGCVWPFLSSPRGQVYDPKTNCWEGMPIGMREGWTGSSAVVDGHLFVISEYERMRVKVYDFESDSWETVAGSPMSERIRKPFSVSCVGSRIFVVGRGLHVVVGHVETSDCSSKKKKSFSIRWQEVDVPKDFADLTPSSTQVLYA